MRSTTARRDLRVFAWRSGCPRRTQGAAGVAHHSVDLDIASSSREAIRRDGYRERRNGIRPADPRPDRRGTDYAIDAIGVRALRSKS